ncbi:MAG: GGDEF domain-containing protein [Sphaerotilus sp.]|nr:GGDEF domain-containing protein [Sphaerotilus sp.]
MPASATPRFRLLRFFSITSLVGIVVVMVGLILAYRALTLEHLIEHESRANTSLTRAFANTTWERYRDFVVTAPGRGREALLADPRMAMLQAEIRQQMQGLQVVKVKVYTPQGLTVFSTEIGQIGEDKSAAPGLIAARAGEVVSSLSYREKFNAFEGEISDRNLMSSYVPVGRAAGSGPEAVFEIYSDVTVLLEHEQEAQWQVSGLVLGLLLALYVFLYFMVRRADRVIERQRRERAAQERAMRHQAHHDLLTGLPNRLSFGPRLERALAQATRTGQPGALLFIDLDRFKQVNDRLGHAAGDRLLKVVAERMRAVLRQEDRLFRMGGDEFTAILSVVDSAPEVARLAGRLRLAASQPVVIEGREAAVGATIGIVLFPGSASGVGTETAEDLLRRADAAMYRAKAQGRGTHAFHGEVAPGPVVNPADLRAKAGHVRPDVSPLLPG